jgi:SAM-dependent methyltransferase
MGWVDDFPAIAAHYQGDIEDRRLASLARLEYLRITEILERYLPRPPATVADLGGGPGTYAAPLAARGYRVHLLDPVASHVARASERARCNGAPLASAEIGVAQSLPWADQTFDVCLCFGPLYHLTDAVERRVALAEVRRILRPGGLLLATAISRFASTYAGLVRKLLPDSVFRAIVERDLADGQHRNPDNHPNGFTNSYCHLPNQLEGELASAGLRTDQMLAVDGPAGPISFSGDLAWWLDDDDRRTVLLSVIRSLEAEPSILGASPQFIAVAKRR